MWPGAARGAAGPRTPSHDSNTIVGPARPPAECSGPPWSGGQSHGTLTTSSLRPSPALSLLLAGGHAWPVVLAASPPSGWAEAHFVRRFLHPAPIPLPGRGGTGQPGARPLIAACSPAGPRRPAAHGLSGTARLFPVQSAAGIAAVPQLSCSAAPGQAPSFPGIACWCLPMRSH